MSGEFDSRALSALKLLLSGPREGDETEVLEKGGGGGETKRVATPSDAMAFGPREGDETETTERGGGSKRQISALGPRDGDETTPIRESPSEPPVRV